jgi:hypothetical protein
MDWLQFVAAITGSLAWPITLIVAFFVLKSYLPAIFPFVERLKYKDLEVEFRNSVQELAEKSRTALPPAEPDDQSFPPRNRLYMLAEISPRSAILEAWLEVEAAAAEVLQSRDPTLAPKLKMAAPLRIGELLNRREIINGQQLEIFHRLRDLRNKAVHIADATFHSNEVTEYIELASSLAAQIRKGTYGA